MARDLVRSQSEGDDLAPPHVPFRRVQKSSLFKKASLLMMMMIMRSLLLLRLGVSRLSPPWVRASLLSDCTPRWLSWKNLPNPPPLSQVEYE